MTMDVDVWSHATLLFWSQTMFVGGTAGVQVHDPCSRTIRTWKPTI